MPTLARTVSITFSDHVHLSCPQVQTRSGAEFSCWDGPHVIATCPSFDFPELLKKSMDRAHAAERDDSGIFSLSPLSSPEPSRPTSPASLPTSTPPFLNGLFSLSPLSSPEPSRPPSPASLTQMTPPLPQEDSPPPNPSETLTIANHHHHPERVKKKKAQSHACRNKKRAKAKQSRFSPYESRPAVRAKYIDNATSIQTATSLESPPVASTAYVALDDRLRSKKTYRLEDVVGPTSKFGFVLQKWDGQLSPPPCVSISVSHHIYSTPMPVIGREGIPAAILAGHPDDDSWPDLRRQAAERLEEARRRCQLPAKAGRHRRGHFAALRCGVSHGGGQRVPGNLQNSSQNDEVLAELNEELPFRRNSGFATSKPHTQW